MKVTGIIAEYNPFHKGHEYQIQKAKEETGADYIVVVMSGDFVQRGTPAIIDKYTRAKMALECGADLVLEMPVIWSTASAEYFASAGIAMLDKMGCVDYVSFGAESTNLELLSNIADVLIEEPRFYKASLAAYMKNGLPFPLAREFALSEYFDASEEVSSIMKEPNNILAIEYLKALKIRKSKVQPHIVLRQGAGYHDTDTDKAFSSATGIRRCLEEIDETTIESEFNEDYLSNLSSLRRSMPDRALALLLEYLDQNSYTQSDDFSFALKYQLLSTCSQGFDQFADCSSDLSNRIMNQLSSYVRFTQFCDLLKSKELTYSRISRVLLHILLGIGANDYNTAMVKCDYVPYLRMLGFCKAATPLLSAIKKNASIPLLTKMADASELLQKNKYAQSMLNRDIFAADLYESAVTARTGQTGPNEYSHGLIMIVDEP